MAIPIATTTITVLRPAELDASDDPYDPVETEPDELAVGVRANIAVADGGEELTGRSSNETVRFRLRADPTDLASSDLVVDDTTGERYAVVWARNRVTGLGLDHVIADLIQTPAPGGS